MKKTTTNEVDAQTTGSAFLHCASARMHCDVGLCHFNKLRVEVRVWRGVERVDIPINSTDAEIAKAIMNCATKLAKPNAQNQVEQNNKETKE